MMPKLVIKRAGGEIENTMLLDKKIDSKKKYLKINKNGKNYYAMLNKNLSTHMFTIFPDGQKFYVQKMLEVDVKVDYWCWDRNDPEKFKCMFSASGYSTRLVNGFGISNIKFYRGYSDDVLTLFGVKSQWTGTAIINFPYLQAVFVFQNNTGISYHVPREWGDRMRKEYKDNTKFTLKVLLIPGG